MTIPQEKRLTDIQVLQQGDPVINNAMVVVEHEDVVYLRMDLATKRCAIVYTVDGGSQVTPGVVIQTTSATPELGETDNVTEIAFPEFQGWEVEMAEITRYTARILLLRDDP